MNIPYIGILGGLRTVIARRLFARCGAGVVIQPRAYFAGGRNIVIGARSGIGARCQLLGRVTIGENVMMGEDVLMITQNHKFDRLDIPMGQQGHKAEQPIVIGNDVWIGSRSIFLPGVAVGNGVIIGAGCVVTKSVPNYAVIVGNPGRVVKFRK